MFAGKNDRVSPFNEQISCTSSNLVMLGKTKSALQFLFRKADEGVMKLNDHVPSNEGRSCTVREVLQELHPAGRIQTLNP